MTTFEELRLIDDLHRAEAEFRAAHEKRESARMALISNIIHGGDVETPTCRYTTTYDTFTQQFVLVSEPLPFHGYRPDGGGGMAPHDYYGPQVVAFVILALCVLAVAGNRSAVYWRELAESRQERLEEAKRTLRMYEAKERDQRMALKGYHGREYEHERN